MNKEFVLYEQALILKELEFNEPCIGYYNGQGNYVEELGKLNSNCNKPGMNGCYCSAPLWQQAFRFFRKKYKLISSVDVSDEGTEDEHYFVSITTLGMFGNYKTYEEAEAVCLDNLIEIVKGKTMNGEEDYGTEITLEELRGHYRAHFLTAEQFIDLVEEWHKTELKKQKNGTAG